MTRTGASTYARLLNIRHGELVGIAMHPQVMNMWPLQSRE